MSMRIAYAGTPEFAVPALRSLLAADVQLLSVITQPDRKSGRGRKIIENPVKKLASSSNVPVFQPEDINEPASMKALSAMDLDLLIVAAYGQIFSEGLLALPRLGCINIHASLLPRWRGASPIQHAILSGDKETGVTIMQMCRAMDAGDIWLQQSTAIAEGDTAQSLHDRLATIGGDVIDSAVKMIADGHTHPQKQAQNKITYCTKLQKQDGMIQWQETCKTIDRKIRAYYPWPGSYTLIAGRRLLILGATPVDTPVSDAAPGTVFQLSKAGLFVATGAGTLRIDRLTPEGGRNMLAADFANANQVLNCVLGE